MPFEPHVWRCAGKMTLLGALCFLTSLSAQVPVPTQTNITVRVMAANLTSGNFQRYEAPGLNILKGLKPDVVAMQEFNCSNSFGINTPAAIRAMVDDAFGTNFVYHREPFAGAGDIPNGIISRYPIAASGSWPSDLGNRGYAWARLDVPGTNDFYVVSVHLKASNDSTSIARRDAETLVIKSNILAVFPSTAWVVIAGDLNVYSETEGAMTNLRSFLSDNPVPMDLSGGTNTNLGRSQRYDRVLCSFSLTSSLVPVVMPSNTFSNGLVFVSTNYAPLSDVPPVQSSDSIAPGMQHMAVVKDFKITYTVTNLVTVPSPYLVLNSPNVIHWQGFSNLAYTVQTKTNLSQTGWPTLGTASSANGEIYFTNPISGDSQRFYRVVYP